MSLQGREPEKGRLPTKKETIFWEGGVKFGGTMTLFLIGADLIREHERFIPLFPPTPRVYLNWLLTLILTPVVGFLGGCLFGLGMWEIIIKRRVRKQGE
jgi:hypothetical protein